MRSATPLASFLFVASILNAQKITTFDVPGSIDTQPTAISTSGDIVGFVFQDPSSSHAFLRKANGTITVFDPAPNAQTYPTAMSPSGQIVGYFSLPGPSATHGFLRDSHGTISTFSSPGMYPFTLPLGIDPRGEIVGAWGEPSGTYGFIREPDGTISTISVGPGVDIGGGQTVPSTWFNGINAAGEICGFYSSGNNETPERHGLLRDPDGIITTFDVLNATLTVPVAINDKGQIAGEYLISNLNPIVQRGFLRDPDGTITTFDVPGAQPGGTNAVAINSKGDIAGFYQQNLKVHGFVRKADGTISTLDVPNATETQPTAMNSRGEITGVFIDASGHERGFVLTQ